MDRTQLLSIEIGEGCNLAKEHTECPSAHPNRYRHLDTSRKMTDNMIVEIVRRMYRDFGFRGLVAWHYYNEPLCQRKRMFRLMDRLAVEVPEARFCLWTNGTLLPRDLKPFAAFEQIVVTDYGSLNARRITSLIAANPNVQVCRWGLDNRLDMEGDVSRGGCGRMFTEFVIDTYGNVHLCCYDWQGLGSPGNVHTRSLDDLVTRWQRTRDAVAMQPMMGGAPAVCHRCKMKSAGVSRLLRGITWLPNVVSRAERSLKALRAGLSPSLGDTPPAVVFVSYLKVPEQRLQDHFRWNDGIYRDSGAKVYVVTDCEHNLPKYAECVLFPEDELPVVNGTRRFSLCKTKNAGIRKAVADGAEVIICTDVDIAFPVRSWKMLACPSPIEAVAPVYMMAPSYERRSESHADHGATGTVSMRAAHWRQVEYDERCVGYGADDGIILADCKAHGLKINKRPTVWHIEHPGAEDVENVPGHGRQGCYGRDEFNFDNFDRNRIWYRRRVGADRCEFA